MKKQDHKAESPDKIIDDTVKQTEDWKSKALRALADYQNLERRIAQGRNLERMHAAEHILRELLPAIDSLFRAQQHLQDKGLELALKDVWRVFGEQGVTKIDAVGKTFNPHEMECIEVVDGLDNQVIEEVAAGYRLHEKVIRPAQVKVGKTSNESTNVKSTNE